MKIRRGLPTYLITHAPTALALGGGSHAGPAASEANAHFPLAMLGTLILVYIISRLIK